MVKSCYLEVGGMEECTGLQYTIDFDKQNVEHVVQNVVQLNPGLTDPPPTEICQSNFFYFLC